MNRVTEKRKEDKWPEKKGETPTELGRIRQQGGKETKKVISCLGLRKKIPKKPNKKKRIKEEIQRKGENVLRKKRIDGETLGRSLKEEKIDWVFV